MDKEVKMEVVDGGNKVSVNEAVAQNSESRKPIEMMEKNELTDLLKKVVHEGQAIKYENDMLRQQVQGFRLEYLFKAIEHKDLFTDTLGKIVNEIEIALGVKPLPEPEA